jgi:hypothetical protein
MSRHKGSSIPFVRIPSNTPRSDVLSHEGNGGAIKSNPLGAITSPQQQQQQGNALSGSGVQDEVQVEVRSKTPPYSPDDKWMQDATQSTKRAQSGHNSFGPFIRKKTTNEDNRNQQGFWRMDTMSRI